MEQYKELVDIEEKIDSTFKLLCEDFNNFSLDKHSTLILEMLRDLMDDKYECIEYYIYELDWGKNGKDCITDQEKNINYSLTNYDELYEYIKLNNI